MECSCELRFGVHGPDCEVAAADEPAEEPARAAQAADNARSVAVATNHASDWAAMHDARARYCDAAATQADRRGDTAQADWHRQDAAGARAAARAYRELAARERGR